MTAKLDKRVHKDFVRRAARRPTRLSHRRKGTRIEALVVVVLGLALVVFPWGSLGSSGSSAGQALAFEASVPFGSTFSPAPHPSTTACETVPKTALGLESAAKECPEQRSR